MALTNFVKSIRNIMRNDAGINGDAQRIEQIAWMLFLKVYDEKENDWEFSEDNYVSFIPENCRWRNWAKDKGDGNALTADALLDFVNNTLFPILKNLEVTPQTPMRSAIVRTTFQDANQYMKDGVLLRQVINVIDQLDLGDYEENHAFGEIYETILKEMQSAGSAGEFYTPRALTDFMAEIVEPKVGEKMADFACGTGGFITSWLKALDKKVKTAEDKEEYAHSIFGIEKKQFPYMLCVTNMLLHDIDSPRVMHDNSLTKDVLNYTDDDKFDVVLMNPPYGGSEKNDIKQHFPSDLSSSETADLFVVLIMYRLKENGRAAVILPDGFLFGTDNAKLAIKEKLLREFNLHTIIRLPGSIFSPYTSIATNILFFNNEKAEGSAEGFNTKETWFYRLDMPEGYKHFSKTKPMRVEHCQLIRDWWTDRREIVDTESNDDKSRCFTAQQLLDMDFNFDQCKFPKDEEEILPLAELLADYYKKCDTLSKTIGDSINAVEDIIAGRKPSKTNGTIKCFQELADLTVRFPVRLRQSILQEAIQGKLVPQDPNDEPASRLLERICEEKKRLVKEGKLKKKDLEVKPIEEDEIPFEVPESWGWMRLGDMVSNQTGLSYSKGDLEKKVDNPIRVLRGGNIQNGAWLIRVDDVMIAPEFVNKQNLALQKNTFITPAVTSLEHLGKTALIEEDHSDIVAGGFVLYLLPFFREDTLVKYLSFFFQSVFYNKYCKSIANKSGQAFWNISRQKLMNLTIPLPPLSEQRRIVAKIEELFGVIKK